MRPEWAADSGVRFIGGREITTITLHPRLFPLLRSAFVAGVASLGEEPVLPENTTASAGLRCRGARLQRRARRSR